MILSKCLDKDIHKQFSNGGNYYGPPVGYKLLFNYDIKRISLCRLYFKKLHNRIYIYIPNEVKYIKKILSTKKIDMSWAEKSIISYVTGDKYFEKNFEKNSEKDFFSKWKKFEIEFEKPSIIKSRYISLNNPINSASGLNPLYIVFSRLISMNCIPCDFLSNEKYTYTKKEYEKTISVSYLIKNSYNSEKISNTYDIYSMTNWRFCLNNIDEPLSLYIILCILAENKNHFTELHKKNLKSIITSDINIMRYIYWKHPVLYYWCIDLNISIYNYSGLVTKLNEIILN